jgi:hypothetical protein
VPELDALPLDPLDVVDPLEPPELPEPEPELLVEP